MVFLGKVAIVTGAARGIGRAVAETLAEGGARVMVGDLESAAIEEVAASIEGDIATFAGDLTEPGTPDRLIDAAVDAFGRVDIVVNNAGYTADGMAHKLSDDEFQAMLDVHAVVPFRVLRAAAPHLRGPAKHDREAGREIFRKVVNVTSTSGTMGNPGQANYAAGKAAVVGLTKTLAKEWGQFKINVNAVAFGMVDTRLTASKASYNVIERGDRVIQLGIPEQLRATAAASIPFGRPATPREAAGGIAFLCSPWSDYVTGQVLTVGGGLSAGMAS